MMRYKQLFFYSVLIVSILWTVNWSGKATGNEWTEELEAIATVMDRLEIDLTNWQLYTREQLNSSSNSNLFKEELALIKEKTKQFQWGSLIIDHSSGQKKAVATNKHHDLGITETLTYTIYPHKEQLHSYLIYELNGTKKFFSQEREALTLYINTKVKQLFDKNAKIFTCATGIGSDKLSAGLTDYAELILAEFSAETVEHLQEETFISVSAYTNAWENFISSNNKRMNLQIALRSADRLGAKTTVTIGTPIITTEY